MRQIGTQSSRYFRKIVTFVLAFAMIITSLTVSSTDSQAAKKTKKVKKVTIGVKVGSSGILVLKKGQSKKLKVSVTPKKASKKVTYKSSKKSVVSVSSKGVVKARKSKGSAKITVTSKQNKKKKATIKVKIGTPVKKVAINKTATSTWQSANWVLKEVNGQKQKVWPKYSEKLTAKNGTYTIMKGRAITLKTTTSPKKATYKKYKWTSSKASAVTLVPKVGSSCKVATKKTGKITITATAMDGSGKKAKVKLNIVNWQTDKTPVPTRTPDLRKMTMVEDFEGYAAGTAWDKYTSAGKDSGHMTVVTDPEDPNNKVLEVKFDGPEEAYDFAPVFNVDLAKLKDTAGKTLGSFSGVKIDARVVGTDLADIGYKKIYVYFDKYGNIQKSDKFAASGNDSNSAHVSDNSLRFGVNIPMAEGSDKESGCFLFNGNASKESDKYFPFTYSTWKDTDKFAENSCTSGFKTGEADGQVGFAPRSMDFVRDRIKEADETLLDQTQFDMVLGSTYKGDAIYKATGTFVTLYLDNIRLIEDDIPLTGLDIKAGAEVLQVGGTTNITVTYTPENSTHKEVIFTTSDKNVASVDSAGKITAIAAGTAVITATSKDNPSLSKSVTITVQAKKREEKPFDDVLNHTTIVGKSTDEKATLKSEVDAVKTADGGIQINFEKNNQSVLLELDKEYDLTGYESLEITGTVPGQMAIELYDSSLDMTKTKSDGAEKDWWETKAGGAYPFFEGSNPYRFEDGARNLVKSEAAGLKDVAADEWKAERQTVTFSLFRNMVGTKDTGDFSKIKYIVLKSNQGPMAPSEWKLNNYFIHNITFTPKQSNGDVLSYNQTVISQENQAKVESGEATYATDANGVTNVKTSADETVVSYYLDILTKDSIEANTKTAENHNDEFDLSAYSYVKVVVDADVTQLDVKLCGKDVAYGDGIHVGTDKGTGARTIYFPLSALGTDADLTKLDTLALCPHGGTIKKATVIQNDPLWEDKKESDDTTLRFPNQYVLNADGSTRALTKAADSNP